MRYADTIEEFELTIKVPGRYETLGVGTKISEEKQGKVNVSRWESTAVHFPTIILGDYQQDSPKTKAQKLDGTRIPVTVHVDKTAMSDWGIRGSQLRSVGEIAVNALNVYRELFGTDYPYEASQECIDFVEGLSITEEERDKIYFGNAERLGFSK